MSWETLIVGDIELKNANDEDIIKIQDYLEFGRNECEKVDIETKNGITKISFQSVNWTSHINEEKVEELLEKLKEKLVSYAISLYYLIEPDHNWYKIKNLKNGKI